MHYFYDETMSKIYEEKGTFNFINNIPQILYSSFISGFIDGLIQSLALTDSKFITLKHNIDRKKVITKKLKTLKAIKIKVALFLMITLPLLLIF